MEKLKPFLAVRRKVWGEPGPFGPKKVECDKCGSKVRYVAFIEGERVCHKCYESFRQFIKERGGE